MNNSRAQMLFDSIPTGRASAMTIAPDDEANRSFRIMVQKANENGDCIINNGYGYFRPRKNSKADREEFIKYCKKECHRARLILFKVKAMQRNQMIDDNQERMKL